MDPATVPAAIGATFGVEEEFHLVDPETFALANRPELSARALAGAAGPNLQAEMLTSQLETATPVCTGLTELRAALVGVRAEAAAAAADVGAAILAASTHPFALLSEIEVMDRPRYAVLTERFGAIVRKLNLTGCHVHVSVPDLDTAVAIMTRARPYLPLLAAITCSSPFHEGADTGYASFRLAWLSLWPQGGPPPVLRSGADYLATAAQIAAVGLVDDPSTILWDLRPSARFPTLEFRIADVCTDVDDAVLYAALARSLTRTIGVHLARGDAAPPDLPDVVLRAARWRAARFGLGELLWSPLRGVLVPAGQALDDLITELRPDLEEHGEYAIVAELLARLQRNGTSSVRQRQLFATSGDLRDVVRAGLRLTAAAG